MKNILLLTLAFFTVLSCSEYSDDGLPGSGDMVILNSDGSKKVKRIATTSTTTMDMNMGMPEMPTNITIVMGTDTETIYESDSYNFVTVSNTTTEFSGMEDILQGEEAPNMDGNITTTTTSVFDGNLLREIRNVEVYEGQGESSSSRIVFSYENDEISALTLFENNVQTSEATFTFNDDNVLVERTFSDEMYGTETINFSVVDSLISSITINNSNSEYTTEISLTRDSVNIAQATITRGSETLLAEYEYDQSHYYNHTLGSNSNLAQRLYSEVLAFSQMINYTTEDQEPLLTNLETSLKGIVGLATHNLTSRTLNGEVVETNNYTYDDDNYPVSFTSQQDGDSTLDISTIFNSLGDTLFENYIEMGMTEEEAQVQVDQILSMFDSTEPELDFDFSATIEYF